MTQLNITLDTVLLKDLFSLASRDQAYTKLMESS